jgi:hypothetical protein
MAEITLPPFKLSQASFGLRRADTALQLMNGREVITEFPQAAWIAQLSMVTLNASSAGAWTGPLSRLTRISNYFRAGPPGYQGAAYKATTLQVDGSGQLGTQLDLKGAQNNTLVLRAGEYFEVGGELKIVVANCTSNGSGLATVQFEPPLRAAPSNSANLNTQTPTAKWRLARPEQSWGLQPKMLHRISLDVVEVI